LAASVEAAKKNTSSGWWQPYNIGKVVDDQHYFFAKLGNL